MKFKVLPYSYDSLVAEIQSSSGAKDDRVEKKLQSTFFHEYFITCNAETIIVEFEYMDYEYLKDYSAFYVSSFRAPKRTCTRMHFFKKSFSAPEFSSILANTAPGSKFKSLSNSYLGFITIKPLPETMFGSACLKPIRNRERDFERKFIEGFDKRIQLFGLPLSVNTLPYQEQDRSLSVCASISLWTAFQATSKIFGHRIPSMQEIGRIALPGIVGSYSMPISGMTGAEMTQAIRSVGLYPEEISIDLKNVDNESLFKNYVYAYINSGIPIILLHELHEIDEKNHEKSRIGSHSVVIVGYRNSYKDITPMGQNETNLLASGISDIYVSDDQVGPYAKMSFYDKKLTTSWRGKDGNQIYAKPFRLIVPLHPSIRVPLDKVVRIVSGFDYISNNLKRTDARLKKEFPKWNWSANLTSETLFKKEIFNDRDLDGSLREQILTMNLPRFLWKMVGYQKQDKSIEILFDATNIGQGPLDSLTIEHKSDMGMKLAQLCSIASIKNKLKKSPAWDIIEQLLNISSTGRIKP